MTYVVRAAYVTVRTRTDQGEAVLGYYSGAPLPAGVNREDLERLLRKGMVAAVEAEPVAQPQNPSAAEVVDERAEQEAKAKAEAEVKAKAKK